MRLPKTAEEEEADKERESQEIDDLAEQAFQRSMRMGERTVFDPSLTLESLQPYAPAFPTTTTGHKNTVMQNLEQLGTQDPVNHPQELQPRSYATSLKKGGLQFFADLREREYTEKYLQERRKHSAELAEAKAWMEQDDMEPQPKEIPLEDNTATAAAAAAEQQQVKQDSVTSEEGSGERLIGSLEDAVKQVILDKAIAGRHEKPRSSVDPIARARAQHLHASTFTMRNVNAFETKLEYLLAGRLGGKKTAAAPRAKA